MPNASLLALLIAAAAVGCDRPEPTTDRARPVAAHARRELHRLADPLRRSDLPPTSPTAGYVEVTAVGIAPTERGHAVVLLERERARALLIFIGGSEALSIELRLSKRAFPRPLTHDLLDSALGELGATVESVRVDRLEDNTYHGTVVLSEGQRRIELDARPSDAIALALGSGASIHVAREVLDRAGVSFDSLELRSPDAGIESAAPDRRSVEL